MTGSTIRRQCRVDSTFDFHVGDFPVVTKLKKKYNCAFFLLWKEIA